MRFFDSNDIKSNKDFNSPIFTELSNNYGFVPNIIKIISINPGILDVFFPFWKHLYFSPDLGSRNRAIAALATAKNKNCDYCMHHMSRSALSCGISQDIISAIKNGEESDELNEKEKLIMQLAEVLVNNPEIISSVIEGRVKELFTNQEIVNLIMAINLYIMTSNILKSFDIEVEEEIFKKETLNVKQ